MNIISVSTKIRAHHFDVLFALIVLRERERDGNVLLWLRCVSNGWFEHLPLYRLNIF